MKNLWILLPLCLLIACSSSDNTIDAPAPEGDQNPVGQVSTESLVALGVAYGDDPRQFVDIYKAASACPTPLYFDAHGNGGTTAMPNSIVEELNAAGISVIAWESLTAVNTQEEVETGWNDAELMFAWVMANAQAYNFDTSNIIIGGSSRGSILSWKYSHNGTAGIKGLYMYNALPGNTWGDPDWWYPPNDVSADAPPIQFVYRREPGSSTDADDPDIHDPDFGYIIMETYEDLGIGEKAALVHSIGETDNTDKYQFLLDFALPLLDDCE
ncbi:MAG: hypothetical protein HRT65_05725 [Flavobacteriaceae bacterium]|nr:hypothetical protein [Flavobacteriaceae bacterium]